MRRLPEALTCFCCAITFALPGALRMAGATSLSGLEDLSLAVADLTNGQRLKSLPAPALAGKSSVLTFSTKVICTARPSANPDRLPIHGQLRSARSSQRISMADRLRAYASRACLAATLTTELCCGVYAAVLQGLPLDKIPVSSEHHTKMPNQRKELKPADARKQANLARLLPAVPAFVTTVRDLPDVWAVWQVLKVPNSSERI